MKDRVLELIDEHLGQFLLLSAVLLAAWVTWANRPQPLPAELTDVKPRAVFVELDAKAISTASAENYFAQGPGDRYLLPNVYSFVPPVVVKNFIPVELEIPPMTVMRAPQLLPDPGPSLQGADKLPRFGEEFVPPSASDLPDKSGKPAANGTTPK